MMRQHYRRTSSYRRRGKKNFIPLLLFLCLIGFIFWAIFQGFVALFSKIQTEPSSAKINILKGQAEFLLPETQDWSLAFSDQELWPKETLKTSLNGKASLEIFENNIIFLGPDTELTILDLEENNSNKKTIKLSLKKGNIWVKASENDFKNNDSIFQIKTKYSVLNVNGTIFDLEHKNNQDIVRLIKGSLKIFVSDDKNENDPALISMGVGQKLIINNTTKTRIDNNEDLLTAIDTSFIESDWHIQNLKIFFPLEAAEIQEKITKADPQNLEESNKESSTDIESPKIISPKNGIKIPASEDTVKIEGTASLDTFQIEINGFSLTKFNPGDKKWTYFAASKFGTLVSGENKFSIVAVSRDGKRSIPTLLTIFYEGKTKIKKENKKIDPKTIQTNLFSKPPIVTSFPAPTITSPNLFDSNGVYKTASSIVTIKGKVSPNTKSIKINGFKLRKFKLGDTTFSYIANAAYGNMKEGLNNYHVVAHDIDNKFAETNIKIQYTPVDLGK